MRDQEVFARPPAMPDDKRLGALGQAGKRRGAFSNHNIGSVLVAVSFERIGHGIAGAYMKFFPGKAAPSLPYGTLGCTDTRPAVYPEGERLYYCTTGAE